MSVIPESHRDILEKKAFAHVATIGPDGAPQCNPVWFDWDGEILRFSQTKARQKYKNLLRDPRIAVSVIDPDNPYRYVEIRGVVEGIDDDENNEFIDRMAKKYIDQDHYPWHQPGDERVVVRVRPTKATYMG
ncbi:MAG: putative pyridoxamine 5'-phosphate oxidase [Acidimicrobiales bacterium]|nr:MAG: putative pyridoxamine 5'-phosphate oxidase [Acidimicrobiales bacterium]